MGWFWAGVFLIWLALGEWIGFSPATGIVLGVLLLILGIGAIADEHRRRNL